MTQVNGKDGEWLYASCADNSLWKMTLTGESKEWTRIGNAINVVSLASHNGWLYCLDKQQAMWQMDLYGPAPQWLPCEAYKAGRLTSITTFDGTPKIPFGVADSVDPGALLSSLFLCVHVAVAAHTRLAALRSHSCRHTQGLFTERRKTTSWLNARSRALAGQMLTSPSR